MVFFTVSGWIYWKDPKGVFHVIVPGKPAEATNSLIPMESQPTVHTMRNSVDKILFELRANLPDLILKAAQSSSVWMTEWQRQDILMEDMLRKEEEMDERITEDFINLPMYE